MTLFLLHFCLDILANIKSGKIPPAFCFYFHLSPIRFWFSALFPSLLSFRIALLCY